jgi:hypothetical protein
MRRHGNWLIAGWVGGQVARPIQDIPPEGKTAILNRDGYRCRLCHRAKRLHIHHIDGRGALSVDPNHDPSNLITLCPRCHKQVHMNGVRITPELLAEADARRALPNVNLPGDPHYRRSGFLVRTEKAVLDKLDP